jgi:putative holliday junction resolvase
MRYLGIDYGAKRIGLSLSDPDGRMAFPHAIVENDAGFLDDLKRLVVEKDVGCIVVGDAKSYAGLRNPVTDDVDDFVVLLQSEFTIPTEAVFEAGSSIEASRYAPEGEEHNDSVAAAIILQRFLDSRKKA